MAIDTDFLVEDLIESVKDRSFAPISQSTFEDSDILRILNEEMLRVVAKIIKVREDFFLARQTTQLVAGKDRYLIPKGASGNALKALFVVDSGGNRRMLTRKDVDQIGGYSTANGDSESFYFEGDEIVLMQPAAGNTDSLLFVHSRRPNRLILTESCAKIESVSSLAGTTSFTVDTDLTGTLSIGSKVDFLRANSPFCLWSEEVSITSINASVIGVATSSVIDVDSTVEPAENDYICPSGYANIAMLPIEFHPVLAQRGARRMISALGHQNKLMAMTAELRELEDDALDIIKNRAESSPERPSRKNGLLRQFRSW